MENLARRALMVSGVMGALPVLVRKEVSNPMLTGAEVPERTERMAPRFGTVGEGIVPPVVPDAVVASWRRVLYISGVIPAGRF